MYFLLTVCEYYFSALNVLGCPNIITKLVKLLWSLFSPFASKDKIVETQMFVDETDICVESECLWFFRCFWFR